MSPTAHRELAIFTVLKQSLPEARLTDFGPAARLNADLALDSVMLLQLIVHLELDHGLQVPEDRLLSDSLETVADLCQALEPLAAEASE
ncbi:MAG: phosphopantetheine-binding protein [Pseudomonadota bacterium]|nr:phosphopantetheine-binding protein [Pseudomonadota bacterium]